MKNMHSYVMIYISIQFPFCIDRFDSVTFLVKSMGLCKITILFSTYKCVNL